MRPRHGVSQKTILHADLDAFFASVEQRDDPSLRGKPVVVGGSVQRGVVAAASYEARQFGIHSAMPMAEALRRCPSAVVVRHHMSRYSEASRQFFAILDDFSPFVEPLSLDEAFVDITGTERLFGSPRAIGKAIKKRVVDELQLVVSVGIAPTKFVAKIASDIDKPNGLRIVEPDKILSFLHPLPVSRLWGVGKVAQARLADLGIRTIADVDRYPRNVLIAKLGASLGEHISALSSGIDPREVEPHSEPVSLGHEETFPTDISDKTELGRILREQADNVAARLRRHHYRARIVVLKLKFADFHQITRRATLTDATCDADVIASTAKNLLSHVDIDDRHGKSRTVRLCGVTAMGLESRDAPRQLSFTESSRERGEKLGDLLDAIHDRFGSQAIRRADAAAENDSNDD